MHGEEYATSVKTEVQAIIRGLAGVEGDALHGAVRGLQAVRGDHTGDAPHDRCLEGGWGACTRIRRPSHTHG